MDPRQARNGGTAALDRGVFLRRRALVVLALAVMAAPWLGPVRAAISGPATVAVARDTYVVRQGDTLWAIAERFAPGEDPRPIVDAIAEANDLASGGVDAGTTLVIPRR